jgi:hypothetical protein
MRNVFFLVVFLSLHSAAQANGIPSRGSCKQLDSENVIFPLPSVTWEGNSAILMSDREATYTEIYGMRPHNEHFKFSVFYTHEIFGLTELIFFGYESGSEVKFRTGAVTYDEPSEGVRVLRAMTGFREAICTVWR